jgi:hypothetical protein
MCIKTFDQGAIKTTKWFCGSKLLLGLVDCEWFAGELEPPPPPPPL